MMAAGRRERDEEALPVPGTMASLLRILETPGEKRRRTEHPPLSGRLSTLFEQPPPERFEEACVLTLCRDAGEPAEGMTVDTPLAPPIKNRMLGGSSPAPRALVSGEDDDEASPPRKKLKGRVRRLLVVDDSYMVRRFMQRTFEQHGYEVDVAQNGWHAFARMQSRVYDFVFLDIEMPVMNGYRCTQALRRWEEQVKRSERQIICALTSHTEPHERDLGVSLGMNLFEPKPTRPSRLLDIVKWALQAADGDAEAAARMAETCAVDAANPPVHKTKQDQDREQDQDHEQDQDREQDQAREHAAASETQPRPDSDDS